MSAAIEIHDTEDAFAELTALHGWLSGRPELRGAVTVARTAEDPEHMGWLSDALTVALGGSGAISVLAGSVATWLVSRRSHVRIKVTGSDGRSVELDVRQAKGDRQAVEALLREVLAKPEDDAT